MEEITISQLYELTADEYLAVDIRDPIAFSYGTVDGAINIPYEQLETTADSLPKDRMLVILCKSGRISDGAAESLRRKGFNAVNLKEGYYGYMLHCLHDNRQKAREVERSIQKKFHKCIWSKFSAAIKNYRLVEPGDKIAVCISGGKDSMLMAKLFQELKRHNKIPFDVIFLVMDPGYSPENRTIIEKNALLLDIPVTFFSSDIFESVLHVDKSPCYLCARMRRGYLYNKAKELGCNKIALGHHYDDVIETILMGMLYGGQIQTMMPKLHSTNFNGMELIRPMYLIREDDIKHWRDYNGLHFLQCACKFTDTCTSCNPDNASKRQEVKRLIHEMRKTNPQVEYNIFKSVENVNLDTVICYKQKDKKIHFLDNY